MPGTCGAGESDIGMEVGRGLQWTPHFGTMDADPLEVKAVGTWVALPLRDSTGEKREDLW